MRGLMAFVTSVIGGKEEKYAIKVKPVQQEMYFVYKSLPEFGALWQKLEQIVEAEKAKGTWDQLSMLGKWLCSYVSHNSFDAHVDKLREQQQEVVTTLNMFLQSLVRRVSGLYVESTILRCGCCHVARQVALLVRNFLQYSKDAEDNKYASPRWRKRQFSEMRPEDEDKTRVSPIFPIRCDDEYLKTRSPKARKLSEDGVAAFRIIPAIRKVDLDTPTAAVTPLNMKTMPVVAPRRRVFAEVDFSTI
ncbi:TPA: hypothetical protein N0F65_006589 [Lagenidium giganteum]|uniref:Uncharacterized protein n=1 Tax=Lagenidium giganteum TaxID=4803 RepID=A0AAV2Z9W6_9STRA|nr:TPA: hypothetical protein N0F65_006589 [Lagenidium giganteum]